MKFKSKLILILIFITSLFLNLYHLEDLPVAFHNDEAETGLEAVRILQGQTPPIGINNFYHLPLTGFLPHTLMISLFGPTIFGLRAASALIGSLTLLFLFYLGKMLYSSKIGLLATALLAFSHFWIAFSRLGINYNLSVFFLILTLIFLTKFLKSRRWQDGFWLGALNASAFYLYFSSRIMPLITLASLVLAGRKKITLKLVLTILFGFLLVATPMLIVYRQQPSTFMTRTNNVFVFSLEVKPWLDDVYQTDSKLKILYFQVKKTFDLSKNNCESSGQYGYCGRITDWLTLFLFLIGSLLALVKIKEIKYCLLLIWFWSIIIFGSFLTVPPLFMPRILGALPVFYLLAALGLDYLVRKLVPKQKTAIIIMIFLFFTLNNLKIYFWQYPQNVWGDSNKYTATEIAKNISSHPDYDYLFLTIPFLYPDFATLEYIAPKIKKTGIYKPADYLFPLKIQKTVYVFYPQYYDKLQEARKIYPMAELTEIRAVPDNQPSAYLLTID